MRFLLAVLLVICTVGFIATSGTVTVQSGALRVNSAALVHTIPVLIALAAPMVTMGMVLMITMMFGRPPHRQNRSRSNRTL